MNKFMKEAISEALDGINNFEGGPFGCVIVKNGEIVGRGHNQVVLNNDCTCHGEMQAIRNACKNLNTFDLSGCELFTTGEPCAMCLAACLWANVEKVFYGCTIFDNEKIGFRDKKFDELLGGRDKVQNFLEQIDQKECLELFETYNKMQKTLY